MVGHINVSWDSAPSIEKKAISCQRASLKRPQVAPQHCLILLLSKANYHSRLHVILRHSPSKPFSFSVMPDVPDSPYQLVNSIVNKMSLNIRRFLRLFLDAFEFVMIMIALMMTMIRMFLRSIGRRWVRDIIVCMPHMHEIRREAGIYSRLSPIRSASTVILFYISSWPAL